MALLIEPWEVIRSFRSEVQVAFRFNLNQLPSPLGSDPIKNDQDTWAHRVIYAYWKLTPTLRYRFKDVVNHFADYLGLDRQEWVVQAIPTFRFQYPGFTGTKEFHRDMDYNHPIESINCILALTEMEGTTSVLVEAVPFTGLYGRTNVKESGAFIFNGSLHKHGTEKNIEGYTRVSCDFRFAKRNSVPNQSSTVTHAVKMKVGGDGYYREI